MVKHAVKGPTVSVSVAVNSQVHDKAPAAVTEQSCVPPPHAVGAHELKPGRVAVAAVFVTENVIVGWVPVVVKNPPVRTAPRICTSHAVDCLRVVWAKLDVLQTNIKRTKANDLKRFFIGLLG